MFKKVLRRFAGSSFSRIFPLDAISACSVSGSADASLTASADGVSFSGAEETLPETEDTSTDGVAAVSSGDAASTTGFVAIIFSCTLASVACWVSVATTFCFPRAGDASPVAAATRTAVSDFGVSLILTSGAFSVFVSGAVAFNVSPAGAGSSALTVGFSSTALTFALSLDDGWICELPVFCFSGTDETLPTTGAAIRADSGFGASLTSASGVFCVLVSAAIADSLSSAGAAAAFLAAGFSITAVSFSLASGTGLIWVPATICFSKAEDVSPVTDVILTGGVESAFKLSC